MADLISIFFPAKSKGKLGTISFDAVLEEVHNFSNDVTDYPVETGKEISDNITLKPVQLTMNGIITDTPLPTLADPEQILNEIFDEGRSQAIFRQLVELRDSRIVFDVVTGLNIYKNMAFVTLSITRDSDTGQSFRLAAELQQVNLAIAKTIIVPPDNIAKRPDKDQKDRGNSDDDKGINDKINQGDISDFFGKFMNKSILLQMLEKSHVVSAAAAAPAP